jgi:hypothetical protein
MAILNLLTDKQWSVLDGEACRVIDFNDTVSHLGNFTPYASITIECIKIPGQKINGFITHKIDYIHLRKAFKERTIKQDEEVIIYWSKKCYKNIAYKIFSAFMPKLWVTICPRGTLELIADTNYKPELKGEARFLAGKPIVEYKPEVMR